MATEITPGHCRFHFYRRHFSSSFTRPPIPRIFAKLGRLASEEVIIQLLKQKCLPILLYALEVCNLDKRSLQSLDFTANRFFMKLFQTSNIEIVHYCQNMSGLQLPSVLLGSRYQKFLSDVSCDVYS